MKLPIYEALFSIFVAVQSTYLKSQYQKLKGLTSNYTARVLVATCFKCVRRAMLSSVCATLVLNYRTMVRLGCTLLRGGEVMVTVVVVVSQV